MRLSLAFTCLPDLTGLHRNDTSLNFGPKNNLLSRHGHCMMFDPVGRKLIIYGGQREDRSLSDLWTYGVDNKELVSGFRLCLGSYSALVYRRSCAITPFKSVPAMASLLVSTISNTAFAPHVTVFGCIADRAIYDPVRREVRFHGGCGCDCFQICKHETADLVAIFDFKNGSWCRYRQTTDDEVLSDPRYAHQVCTQCLFGRTAP